MPKFFVPNTDSPEDAEEAYASMRKHNYVGKKNRVDWLGLSFTMVGALLLLKSVANFVIFLSPPGKSSRSSKRQMS